MAPEASLAEDDLFEVDDKERPRALTPAMRLERSPIVALVLGGAGLLWLFVTVRAKGGGAITLNFVNFAFLTLGLLLHWRPSSFLLPPSLATVMFARSFPP